MQEKLKIDIISDVVCPWCIVGYQNLNKAIKDLGVEDKITIEWQPFELNPDMPPEGEELKEHIQRKYGASAEDSAKNRKEITSRGAETGFVFDFYDDMRIVNTRDAHVLLEFAKEQGKQTEFKLRLFSAYFTDHKDVSDQNILLEEIAALGLDSEAAREKLNDQTSHNHIQAQESEWHQLGVSSVPTVVFNRQSALAGAQPVETFKQVLTELLAE